MAVLSKGLGGGRAKRKLWAGMRLYIGKVSPSFYAPPPVDEIKVLIRFVGCFYANALCNV